MSDQGGAQRASQEEFKISERVLGRSVVLEVTGPSSFLTLSTLGATLLRWVERDAAGESIELVDGYGSGEELSGQDGMRSAIMVPFSNRVDGGRYTWEGRDIEFASPSGVPVLHGLLRDRAFEIRHAEAVGSTATVAFTSTELRPGRWPGYPFAVDVTVEYVISARRVSVAIYATNVGNTRAPFCSGWHPYFALGDVPADELVLHVPASVRVVTDEALIPMPESAAYAKITEGDPWDFTRGSRIGNRVIDTCFTELARNNDGFIVTNLADEMRGRALHVWQERGSVHVYTGDGLRRAQRRSVAVEPVEALTNALNRPDQYDAIVLEPGADRRFKFGATVELE